jgi:peptide/nickel transport system permease protein
MKFIEFRNGIKSVCMRDIFSTAAAIIISFYIMSAIFAETYSIFCSVYRKTPIYDKGNLEEAYMPPSRQHLLGTDFKGRDVLLRAFFASKTALKVGIFAGILSVFIGILLGIVSGYFGGIVDEIIVWFYSSVASIPTLLFVLAFSLLATKGFFFPPLEYAFKFVARFFRVESGMLAIYIGIGMTGWVGLCRILRAETMRAKNEPYALAATSLGFGNMRIIFRHILPNLMHIVIIYFTLRFGYAVMTEVIVSYLGFGVQAEPSWGTMISDGQSRLWRGVWWEITAATAFMFFLVLSLNIIGDALRDALDPKMRI